MLLHMVLLFRDACNAQEVPMTPMMYLEKRVVMLVSTAYGNVHPFSWADCVRCFILLGFTELVSSEMFLQRCGWFPTTLYTPALTGVNSPGPYQALLEWLIEQGNTKT